VLVVWTHHWQATFATDLLHRSSAQSPLLGIEGKVLHLGPHSRKTPHMVAKVRQAALNGIDAPPVEVKLNAWCSDTVVGAVGLLTAIDGPRDQVTRDHRFALQFDLWRHHDLLTPAHVKEEGQSLTSPYESAAAPGNATDTYEIALKFKPSGRKRNHEVAHA
jgi:hypothetical protein